MEEFYKYYLQALFIVLHFTSLTDTVILQIEGLWQPFVAQVYWHHFPTAFAHFMTPCQISVILTIF